MTATGLGIGALTEQARDSFLAVFALVALMAVGGCAVQQSGSLGVRSSNHLTVALGTVVHTSGGNRVAVLAYRPTVGVTPSHPRTRRTHVAAASIRVCATASGGRFGPAEIRLVTTDGTRLDAEMHSRMQPALRDQSLARRHCARGWVTFRLPDASTAKLVLVTDASEDVLRWKLR
jgi:hypothetical protein